MLFSHLGHVRVFALIHCDVPASSRAFLSQLLTNLQMIGRWSDSNPHPKQNACPAPHLTVGTTVASDDRFADVQDTVCVQPGYGQKRSWGCAWT